MSWDTGGLVWVPGAKTRKDMQGYAGGDPLWDKVVSLVTMQGALGATAPVDLKGPTWARAGSPTISDIDRSPNLERYLTSWRQTAAGDLASTAYTSAWDLSGDFTIEGWTKTTGDAGSGFNFPFCMRGGAGAAVCQFQILPSGFAAFWYAAGEVFMAPVELGSRPPRRLGLWDHWASSRVGEYYVSHYNGKLSAWLHDTRAPNPNSAPIVLGGQATFPNRSLIGSQGPFRATMGAARYGLSDFDPPLYFPTFQG